MTTFYKSVLRVVSALSIIFFSCGHKSSTDLVAFKALSETLEYSNEVINNNSETIYNVLHEKLYIACTRDKAEYWYPKTMFVRRLSREMIIYIDSLKRSLKERAGLTFENQSFREDASGVAEDFFLKNGNAENLYDRLLKHKMDLLVIDPKISNQFKNIRLLTKSFDFLEENRKLFAKTFFKSISVAGGIALLDLFENSIKMIENNLSAFCNEQVVCMNDGIHNFTTIVTQSSTYVRSGEMIEITAGVGGFIIAGKPVISINDAPVKITETGAALYRFNASEQTGEHFVRIKISYTDIDGRKVTQEKTIKYVVVKGGVN